MNKDFEKGSGVKSEISPADGKPPVTGSVICVICGSDTGLIQEDLEDCDPVCSEECSNKREELFR